MFVIMLISAVVLLFAFATLFYFQAYTLRQQSAHELAVVGEITAHNCAAAVMFKDEDAAAQLLTGLKTMPQIVGARLQLMDRQRLASFGNPRDEVAIKSAPFLSGFQMEGDRILLAQPVLLNGKRAGTLFLLADLHAMTAQLLRLFGGIFGLVLAASLLVTFVLSTQFQRFITNPILSLTGTARTIADHKDYSVRAPKLCDDEVGVLTDAFNQMLGQIQSQDSALQSAGAKLQEKVNALQREISERERAEAAHARLTAILEATPDIVISAHTNGTAFYLNYAARDILGLNDGTDISGLKLLDVQPDWARKIVMEVGFPTALENGSWAGETAIRNCDGEEIHVSQVLIAHRNAEGGLEYLSTVMRDITERRQAEEALHLSQQKLVETSRLAGWQRSRPGATQCPNVLNSVNVSASLVVESCAVPKRQAGPSHRPSHRAKWQPRRISHKDPNGRSFRLPRETQRVFVTEMPNYSGSRSTGSQHEHIKEVVRCSKVTRRSAASSEIYLPTCS